MTDIEQLVCDVAVSLGAMVKNVSLHQTDSGTVTGHVTLMLMAGDGNESEYQTFDCNLPEFRQCDDIELMVIHHLSGFILDKQETQK